MSDTIEQRLDEIRKELLYLTGEPRDRFQYNGIDSTNDTDKIMESITTLLNVARIDELNKKLPKVLDYTMTPEQTSMIVNRLDELGLQLTPKEENQ